ncbi:MAG: N-formylglutamate deformylase [Robiginitomaculum sp.]
MTVIVKPDNRPVTTVEGDGPMILGLPHSGTFVPREIWDTLNGIGRKLADTDWHVDRLYEGLHRGLTTVAANFHRYVIDPNRSPNDGDLYPGKNSTGLVPLTDFEGKSIWKIAPSSEDIFARQRDYHAPYHAALKAQIARVKAKHGLAILYDCHSIRGEISYLFEGRLPDLNIGDNSGASCSPLITKSVADICEDAEGFTHVVNGRFRGGWTTRHYGRPGDNVHAIQMELVQALYLKSERAPYDYDFEKAKSLRLVLREILTAINTVAHNTSALSGALSET